MTRRRLSLWIILSAFCAAFPGPGGCAALDCRDCNVILISVDTLRADALGIYGSKFGASPNIDRAAQNGFVFLNAYSPAPNTHPSHMSLFTGLYPSRHGLNMAQAPGEKRQLSKRYKTLAQILRSEGYKTAWFGPLYDPHLDLTQGFERGFDFKYLQSRHTEIGDPDRIQNWIAGRGSDKFFIFLHNYNMHVPYAPRRSTLKLFAGRLLRKDAPSYEDMNREAWNEFLDDPSLRKMLEERGLLENPDARYAMAKKKWGSHFLAARLSQNTNRIFFGRFNLSDPGDLKDLKTLYEMSVFDVDAWFEGIRRKLAETGLLGKTLVIITSDHGEEFREHGGMEHYQLYEECLRVPLIFLHPQAGEGRGLDAMAGTVDVLPTILDILGLRGPPNVQGISLKPFMEGGGVPAAPRRLYAEWWGNSTYAVRDSSFTFLSSRLETFEGLYDRRRDRKESVNLIHSEPQRADEYRVMIQNYQEDRAE